jgi:two-component system, OmpR family, sensor histidine kinase VicK
MNNIYIFGGGAAFLSIVIGVLIVLVRKSHKKVKSSTNAVANLSSDLRSEREKSEIIINSIDDGVMLLDKDRIIRLFNPAAGTITGWPVDEAIGIGYQNVLNFVNEKSEPVSSDTHPIEKGLLSVTTYRDNNANIASKANKLIPISVSISPLTDKHGKPDGAVAIFRDVTNERTEEKQRAEFISTASHEMRTPVAAIEGYLSLALNEKVAHIDAKARDYLDKAHQSTQHLGKLFQDLLTAAKSEDGRITSHPVTLEMGKFLSEIVEDVRFTAEKKSMLVDYMIGSSTEASSTSAGQKVIKPLYFVNADPDRLREVIINLFDNAVKYSEKGKITIGLTGDDKVVQFRISDQGFGIPAEDVSHLFQKFYRVDNSATRTIGGTGLGLFICRKIVELYNGRIWVESQVDKGSTFFINLPRLTTAQANTLLAQSAGPADILSK